MNKIIFPVLILILIITTKINADTKVKCDTLSQKLTPKCNFLGKSMNKIKDFSEKNKTLDKSFQNIKTTVEEKIKK